MKNMNKKQSEISKQSREKTNYKVLSNVLIILILSVPLTSFLSMTWSNYNIWKITILSFLATVQSLLIALILWEIIAKKSFAEELLLLSSISSNINKSGIEYVYVNFLEIDWREVLERANELTVVMTYGKTWRDSNRDALEKFHNEGGRIKIYLPDFHYDEISDELDRRFSYEKGKTKSLIHDTCEAFCDLNADIFYYKGTFQNSYYLVDDISYMSFFNHHKEKKTVPAIKAVKGGTIYSYVSDEIAAISKNSVKRQGDVG
ncbi:MAG: hypothetical protein KMY55_01530 [Dethiosulfatibacter sp.]|nr:hypothetical protein [Dethiosulfatibacter sp.]